MVERIPIAGPWVSDREISYVTEAAAEGWYGRATYYTERFETAFARYLGVKHAVSVPHCTSAIHLALAGLGIGPGDEVIVPDITWIASAAPICYVGATPVFADVDPKTWCISPDSVRKNLTTRTRAIIPVGLYGLHPDMDSLCEIAEERDLLIVEDCAQTLGSKSNKKLAGTFGHAAVFSFHGTKTMTTGEGGMLATDDDALFDRVQTLRDHGRNKYNYRNFYNAEVAYKYRMSNLQAAFGLGQLERIDELIDRKRVIFQWYADRLIDIPGLMLNPCPQGFVNTFWMTTVILDPQYKINNQDLMIAFDAEGIDVRPFFHPLSSLPAFSKSTEARAAKKRNHFAYSLSPRGINLPSALILTEKQVDHVCTTLRKILLEQ